MDKKISSTFGILVILIVAITIGITLWLAEKENFKPKNKIPVTAEENNADDKRDNDSKQSEINNISTPKKRFYGDGCYKKENNGSDNLYELSSDFNLDTADSFVLYENKDKEISFRIPYNENWGNEKCKVESYVEFIHPSGDVIVEFGEPRAWLTSYYHLTISKHRTAEEIIPKQRMVDSKSNPNLTEKTLGDNELVVFNSYGMTNEIIYEVIGKKYNYSFSYIYIDAKPIQKDIDVLEDIIKNAIID